MRNRIRLPIVLKNAQFPSETSGFRLANGVFKNISTIIRKTYQVETDQIPERFHQRLIIALSHDEVSIESDKFVGDIAKDGDYQINWQDFLYFPLAKAEVQVQVTPFDASNDNCAVCNEYAQLDLDDDSFYPDLDEGEEATLDVFANDSICCAPITAEIVYTNSTYVESASIDEETGILTVLIKDPAPDGTGVKLVTYRVTCPNGQYDDADVYGSVNGSEEICQPVGAFTLDGGITDTTAFVEWLPSASAVTAYLWSLYLANDLGTPVQTGDTTDTFIALEDLLPGTDYVLSVTVDCAYSESNSVSDSVEFATESIGNSCGVFKMTNDGFPSPATVAASYMDCNGIIQHVFVGTTMSRCMMMDSPGVPTYLVIHPGGSWVYIGVCGESVAVELTHGSSEELACSGIPSTYYVAAPYADIEPGVYVYTDEEMTTLIPASGFLKNSSGIIYFLSAGLVGATTGTAC